ncbi:C39 family peptidase [Sporosarcina sp. GW1-11]|uniref:C39 family peptidase n=1 Tax=Sporosarcina sp. GW1-11 TaxID=2899126 RepID=UPI00294F1510|nr:C39 family peptidase [Sporosarcina sp. GW1-11]MDV6379026.1 C39 family peptidase [Sporosarcina sp. GW1-11]
MAKFIDVQGKSQYDRDIEPAYRPSACGPVTAFVLLRHLFPHTPTPNINELYQKLGGTKIGLPTWRFIRRLGLLLGADWQVEKCDVQQALQQIDENRPVALKFDKWFNFKWRGQFSFDYHWVVMVGYDYVNGALHVLVHDNGGRNCESTVRSIPYEPNKAILTFVKIEPSKR